MKLNLSNTNTESANVQNVQVNNNPATIVVKKGSKPMTAEEYKEEPIEDAVIVSDAVEIQNSKKQKPKATKTKGKKSEARGKKPQPSDISPQTSKSNGKLSVITYTTRKGGTACYIAGFASEAHAKVIADQLPHSINSAYRYNDKGEKVFVISFGTRYVEVATSLCAALNANCQADVHKCISTCHSIYNGVIDAAIVERKKKQEERKAAEAAAKTKELDDFKKKHGLMSQEEVVALLQRALAGEDVPELECIKKMLHVA